MRLGWPAIPAKCMGINIRLDEMKKLMK
jgi:hypothetical protein